MSTLSKTESNRQNALASTGPRSADGKAVVSCNAIRHGLLSWKPAIPGRENDEDWEIHLERMLESLAPVGYIETLLAERVALLVWRLGRVARYEREVVSVAVETAEPRWTQYRVGKENVINAPKRESPLVDVDARLRAAREELELVKRLRELPDTERADSGVSIRLVKAAAELADVNLNEDDVEIPDYPEGATLGEVAWTAGLLIKTINAIATYHPGSEGDLVEETTQETSRRLQKMEREKAELEQEFSQYCRKQLIPDSFTVDRVIRYETALERSLYKALHELERRQASRTGQTVPLPIAVDVNVSGASQE